jgi:hypothetical protein
MCGAEPRPALATLGCGPHQRLDPGARQASSSNSEVQTARNEPVATGDVERASNGLYECADPLVPQLWLDQAYQRLKQPARESEIAGSS